MLASFVNRVLVFECDQAEEGWATTVAGLAAELERGRLHLWQDVAHRITVLLAAPAAFSGEHFVQVPP